MAETVPLSAIPHLMIKANSGVEAAEIRANVVNAQPLPIALTLGWIMADATAPSSHMKNSLAAVAAPDRPGHRSNVRVLSTCMEALRTKLVAKRMVISLAMWIWNLSSQL